eukprot:TRINITY_DN25132_c0_g1_i1.p1 TRINITY_DN25132_c0_g1~~TRINITY_DN25132_c0_g1_i1.p1  ORF type:complete len:275 (-),score=65.25 TRINITY_DN25132_c0_g1_i1:38-862(-)
MIQLTRLKGKEQETSSSRLPLLWSKYVVRNPESPLMKERKAILAKERQQNLETVKDNMRSAIARSQQRLERILVKVDQKKDVIAGLKKDAEYSKEAQVKVDELQKVGSSSGFTLEQIKQRTTERVAQRKLYDEIAQETALLQREAAFTQREIDRARELLHEHNERRWRAMGEEEGQEAAVPPSQTVVPRRRPPPGNSSVPPPPLRFAVPAGRPERTRNPLVRRETFGAGDTAVELRGFPQRPRPGGPPPPAAAKPPPPLPSFPWIQGEEHDGHD